MRTNLSQPRVHVFDFSKGTLEIPMLLHVVRKSSFQVTAINVVVLLVSADIIGVIDTRSLGFNFILL
jgi:hypothetical protein